MKSTLSILTLLIALTACAAPVHSPVATNAGAPTAQPRAESATSYTPSAVPSRRPQSTPPRQTPQANGGSNATQSLSLDFPVHPIDVILGRPTQNSIVASVMAYEDGDAFIEWGTQTGVHPNKTQIRALTKMEPVEIPLDGLASDTAYFYQLFYRAGHSGAFTSVGERAFHTERGADHAFTFDVQADSHLDSNSSLDVYSRTLANERADRSDFLIDLGDTFMTGKYQPYMAAQKQYLAQRYFFGILAPSPLFLVLGNHDGEGASQNATPSDLTMWATKWRTQYFPNPTPNGFYSGNATVDKNVGALEDYYAWEWGDAFFIVLDPYRLTSPMRAASGNWDSTLGVVQYQWLKQTLETSRARWKFIFIHQLVGGLDQNGRGGAEAAKYYEWGGNNADGSYGFAAERPGWAMPIHSLLVANQVTAVFHGHDHLFAKQDLDGVVYQEVPQPSAARSDVTGNARDYGYVTGDILGSSGHLRVTVSTSQVKVAYVRSYASQSENAQHTNGQVAYTYALTAR